MIVHASNFILSSGTLIFHYYYYYYYYHHHHLPLLLRQLREDAYQVARMMEKSRICLIQEGVWDSCYSIEYGLIGKFEMNLHGLGVEKGFGTGR